MIKFNSEGKQSLTYREICDPAMEITDKDEAIDYLTDYTEWIMEKSEEDISIDQAIDVACCNLGHFSGYYSKEKRKRFMNVFGIEHPIFGSKTPTAKEAFQMGVNFSKSI